MKKSTVVFVFIFSLGAFGLLLYYGFRHKRGVPTVVEKKERVILEVPFLDENIVLKKGISLDLWENIAPKEIELIYQLTILPWPKRELIPSIIVKAFHNNKDIYFYVSWKDQTEDNRKGIDKFPDASAIMFPMNKDNQPSSIMMGFLGKSNIWHWKADRDAQYWAAVFGKTLPSRKIYVDYYYPFDEEEVLVVSKETPKSAVNDLMAIRIGTLTSKEKQNVQGRGIWDKGVWHTVFKRSFNPEDAELGAVFEFNKKKLCAFAVWNGTKGDRGGRKSISDWVELEVKK